VLLLLYLHKNGVMSLGGCAITTLFNEEQDLQKSDSLLLIFLELMISCSKWIWPLKYQINR